VRFESNAWPVPKARDIAVGRNCLTAEGYGDLGYVLRDEAIIKKARRWIEAVLASQEEDGWFGRAA